MIARASILALVMMNGAVVCARDTEPAATAPAQEEAAEQEQVQTALPGLDELLGIGKEMDGATDDAALDTNKAELERELTNEELGEQFVQAIKQMQEAAVRLQRGRDGGVVTQRLQEEILLKLDILIEQSQDSQGGGGSGSASSGESSGNTPPQSGGQESGQQQQEGGGEAGGGQGGAGDPSYSEGKNELIEAVGAGWGALPERVRETLLEGLNDVFSSRYKEQTEAYYRRLAEEGAAE